jgi:hypothetical protein
MGYNAYKTAYNKMSMYKYGVCVYFWVDMYRSPNYN